MDKDTETAFSRVEHKLDRSTAQTGKIELLLTGDITKPDQPGLIEQVRQNRRIFEVHIKDCETKYKAINGLANRVDWISLKVVGIAATVTLLVSVVIAILMHHYK